MSDSRYRVLGQPTSAPGHCYITGETGAEHGPYVDTGMNVRPSSAKGALYIGRAAITEMYEELRKYEGINPDLKYSEADMIREKEAAYEGGFRDGIKDTKERLNDFLDSTDNSDDSDGLFALVAPSFSEFETVQADSGSKDAGDASVRKSSGKDNAASSSKKRGSVSSDSVLESADDDGDGPGLGI